MSTRKNLLFSASFALAFSLSAMAEPRSTTGQSGQPSLAPQTSVGSSVTSAMVGSPGSQQSVMTNAYAAVETTQLEVSNDHQVTQPMAVCMPDIEDGQPALRSDCITVLEDVAKRKGRFAATNRDKRELRSLCQNQWLPRCRHKY